MWFTNASLLRVPIDAIAFPIARVVVDIGTDIVQSLLVADDAIMIIALPDRRAEGMTEAVDVAGRNGFVIACDRAN